MATFRARDDFRKKINREFRKEQQLSSRDLKEFALSTEMNQAEVKQPGSHQDLFFDVSLGNPIYSHHNKAIGMYKPYFHEEKHFHGEMSDSKKPVPKVWHLPNLGYFVGRLSKRKKLRSYFIEALNNEQKLIEKDRAIIVCMFGLGGTGKTLLALEYAHQHLAFYEHIFWFSAKDAKTLENDYFMLADELKQKNYNESPQMTIERLKQWLNDKNRKTCLLIYDNVTDENMIRPYLSNQKHHILITSRYTAWDHDIHSVPLGIFNLKECFHYVHGILGKEYAKKEEIELFVKTLGYLPLALAQACSYLKFETFIDIAEYVNRYKNNKKLFLNQKIKHGFLVDELPVLYTWNTTCDLIQKISLLAINVLNIVLFLNNENIPVHIFSKYMSAQWMNPNQEFLEDALRKLVNYSLVKIAFSDSSHKIEDAFISLHPLQQEALKINLNSEECAVWHQRAADLIYQFFVKEDFCLNLEWKKINFLTPHVNALLNNTEVNFPSKALELTLIGLKKYQAIYDNWLSGETEKSLKILKELIHEEEKDPKENRITLIHLSFCLFEMRDFKAAELYLNKAKELKIDSSEVIILYIIETVLHNVQGKYQEGFDMAQKTLQLFEKQYQHHSMYSRALMVAGHAAMNVGKIDYALKLYLQGYELAKQQDFGFRVRVQLPISISQWYEENSQITESIRKENILKYIKEAMIEGNNLYGINLNKILRSYTNPSLSWEQLKIHHLGVDFIKDLIQFYNILYGKEHLEIAKHCSQLGLAYEAKSEYLNALNFYKTALDILNFSGFQINLHNQNFLKQKIENMENVKKESFSNTFQN